MSLTSPFDKNPLLDFNDLPLFSKVQPQHITPAIDDLIEKAEAALALTVSDQTPVNWHAVSKTLDIATEQLSRAWSAVGHLKSVKDSPELREAVNATLPKITAFWTQLGQDERLYDKYKKIQASKSFIELNAAEKRALKLTLQAFALSGAELKGEQKTRYAQIQEEFATLMQRFSEHLLDATDAWELYVEEKDLKGVPADIITATQMAAKSKEKSGCLISLQPPIYIPIMQYAEDQSLREKLYHAYVTRASELGDEQQDNTGIINQIIALREEEAQLLGYKNYGEVSLVPKMANSPAEVIQFLKDLADKALPYARKDYEEIKDYALNPLGIKELNAWDIAYVSEKLKEERYAFSDQEVKEYFPQDHVINGLFKVVETLFEVEVTPDTTPAALEVWNPDVNLYQLKRDGRLIGQFYTDLTAREGKRAGAWMNDVRSRWLRPDTQQLQTPVAHLVCNFAKGVNGNPPLLTHDDVSTLFHEFGHTLHHLLTQVSEIDVSGIAGVEWDAVELPSQFMENFCWEWEVIQNISSHVELKKPLPKALFDKMIAAKNYQSGMQTVRQIEFSLFDMLLHSEFNINNDSVQSLLNKVRKEVAVTSPPSYNRFQCSFSHIFAGGYAAGYYSYKWAEVLSADAYYAFEDSKTSNNGSILNVNVGRQFRQEILETGGSRPAIDSFQAFRGRLPTIDALLRHQGMSDEK